MGISNFYYYFFVEIDLQIQVQVEKTKHTLSKAGATEREVTGGLGLRGGFGRKWSERVGGFGWRRRGVNGFGFN